MREGRGALLFCEPCSSVTCFAGGKTKRQMSIAKDAGMRAPANAPHKTGGPARIPKAACTLRKSFARHITTLATNSIDAEKYATIHQKMSHVFAARDLDCADLDGREGRSNTTRSQALPSLAAPSAKGKTPALTNDTVSPRPFVEAFFVAVRTALGSLST